MLSMGFEVEIGSQEVDVALRQQHFAEAGNLTGLM